MISIVPDRRGYFGPFGGQFVPETLVPALEELQTAFFNCRKDKQFKLMLDYYLKQYAGRPTPLYFAERFSERLGGRKIYLKREDLLHTGAHKINNCLGQGLLAKKLGKKRIIAETGAGQHGVATAAVAAMLGLECEIYMGEIDAERQKLNVFRMRLLGAKVNLVYSGGRTLKDAVNDALRDWTANVKTTHYLLGSALGPHPYPLMVREFQRCIGQETKKQIIKVEGRLPDLICACVGGGSNAIGIFYDFLKQRNVKLVGVEAGGLGIQSGKHASRFSDPKLGRHGVLHGSYTYTLQNPDGQIYDTYSISAGLDYSAVGPEHACLRERKRVSYTSVTDAEALEGLQILSECEGIIPALESAHAVGYAMKIAKQFPKHTIIIINLSGRGDKDMQQVIDQLGSFNS